MTERAKRFLLLLARLLACAAVAPIVCLFGLLWCALVDGMTGYFHYFSWDTVSCGGAFDQGGLTKMVAFTVAALLFPVLLGGWFWLLFLRMGKRLRMGVGVLLAVLLLLPLGALACFEWELSRLIFVMGVTSDRVTAVVGAVVLVMFILTALVELLVPRPLQEQRLRREFGISLLCAGMLFVGIYVCARQATLSHPWPQRCLPNGVAVPQRS